MFRPIRSLLIAFCVFSAEMVEATPVKLVPVEATTAADARLVEAVDGIETPGNGWVVPQAAPQQGVFCCVPPIHAGRVQFHLVFDGGATDSVFGEFSISATTDPHPSLSGHWRPIYPMLFAADSRQFERTHLHLHFVNQPLKARVSVSGILPDDFITGIRIESWPSPNRPTGNAILTELSMERSPLGTTNIALGCPVTASRELAINQYAEALTDGLNATSAHPLAKRSGPDFYFEVDLLRVRDLDHVNLCSVAQNGMSDRFVQLHLQLFDEEPTVKTAPVWEGQVRETGTMPEPGAAEVVRGVDGQGIFRGRYLRIFSTSDAIYAPQIAEVEVFESLVAPGVKVLANNRSVPATKAVRIPADTNWLTFSVEQPFSREGPILGSRCRIVGGHDEWLPSNWRGDIETRGLPPGEYLFEAQLRHTDGEWNSAPLRLPFIVSAPWWKNPWAQVAMACGMAAIAAFLASRIARRRMALRLAELERRQELSRERGRIARDMHDVVGARLTQLAIMQETVAVEHPQAGGLQEQLQQLSVTAREAVNALDEVVWAVNPRNDTLQNLADYICNSASLYLTPLNIASRHDVPDEWPVVEVVSQKRHQLLLAVKEALQNVAKHACASEVTVILRYEQGGFLVRIEDNGCGLPPVIDGAGQDGVGNMEERLASIGGSCVVRSRQEGGTVVQFLVPI